jgi:hypothetical protein
MTVITVGLPLLIALIFKYLNAKIGVEKMAQIKQEINNTSVLAEAAVIFIQQKYPDLANIDKLALASEWLATEASNRGIELSQEQIEGYLESALKIVKDSFGENWNS